MSLNDTPVADRIQIGFFGCTNSGKSSLINAIAGQEVAVVSDKKGTTTDPVIKTMELGDLGPVALIDTPGLDDDTDIGELRVNRANEMFDRADIAVIVMDAEYMVGAATVNSELSKKVSSFKSEKKKIAEDTFNANDNKIELERIAVTRELINKCLENNKPFVIAVNKAELFGNLMKSTLSDPSYDAVTLPVSALKGMKLNELKEELIRKGKALEKSRERKLVSDLIEKGDTVILVIPLDESAPKGRLILPQQQVIRDILDTGGNAICIKDTELEAFFKANVTGNKGVSPKLVITDSQVFSYVAKVVPISIPLTSFSILMARYKGSLKAQLNGAKAIDKLQDGDTVLIAEGCTHHKTCDDIGTVKLPNMLKKYTGKDIIVENTSGHGFVEDLSEYSLILHCGGCMLGESEINARMQKAAAQDIPITNYGVAIAHMSGILKRSLEPLPGFIVR